MTNLFKMRWGIFALVAVFCFSSCKDDDMSMDEMRDEILSNGNDLLMDNLYGKVKTVTESYYGGAQWINDRIVEGEEGSVTITNYDLNGFKTGFEFKYRSNGTLYSSAKGVVVSRDSKKRVTEYLYTSFDMDGNIAYINKSITTYDDNAKTAIVISSQSYDEGETFEETSKTIYKLNRYGKIDEDNSSIYYPVYNDIEMRTTRSFETKPSEQYIQEYDTVGNPTLSYKKDYYSDYTSIYDYTKTTYVYY